MQDVVVYEKDCKDNEGAIVSAQESKAMGKDFYERIIGRYALEEVVHPKTKKVLVKKGAIISHELETELNKAPDSRQLRNRLAVIYANMNDIEVAEKHLQYLVAMDSTDAVAINNLGNVLFMKGDLDSAETLYLTAISFADSKRDSDGIYLNLGLIYALKNEQH